MRRADRSSFHERSPPTPVTIETSRHLALRFQNVSVIGYEIANPGQNVIRGAGAVGIDVEVCVLDHLSAKKMRKLLGR